MVERTIQLTSLLALALVVSAMGCKPSATTAGPITFVEIEHDAAHAQFSVAGVPGEAYVVPLSSFRFRVLPAGGPTKHRKVDHIVRSLQDSIAVNGSFFDEEHRAMGLAVDEGRAISKRRLRAWNAMTVKGGRARIVSGGDIDLNDLPDTVIQGQPRLVAGGVVPSNFKPQRAERTAICLRAVDRSENGDFTAVTLVTTGSVQLKDFAEVLSKSNAAGGLGCTEALNLDGGPSTQLVVRLGNREHKIRGSGDVPNALVAIPRTKVAEASVR